jgi:deoxycytidylate deaminase
MSNPHVAVGLKNLFQRRADFVVIGLTGRTGSGCSTAANLLSQEFDFLKATEVINTEPTPEQRKYRIARDYAASHWKPFFNISISNIILSFLLDAEESELKAFLDKSEHKLKPEKTQQLIDEWKPAAAIWNKQKYIIEGTSATNAQKQAFIESWQKDFSQFFQTVRKGLGPDSNRLLQFIGDNLRRSGNPLLNELTPENFYVLPDRAATLIEIIRDIQRAEQRPTYIVLDALRNPFEILYFRERFSSFYLVAVTTENEDREKRLAHLSFGPAQIAELDKKEYPEKNKPLSGYEAFTSQNIQSCLEKADIYLRNIGSVPPTQQPDLNDLTTQLIRYFSLMIHPGLVTPTRTERCMQIAFSARANSGCISRQVGAAITDKYDSVKAIGWNDGPAGQTPCILRRSSDLLNNKDEDAFSVYEYKDKGFRQQVESSYKRFSLVDMGGRSSAFCFKSEYNSLKKEDNQVHTRSLHAEENAFLQLAKHGSEGIYGGKLYTTASPCELCAKKAFQLGIKHIYYIDPYPGISLDHILKSGTKDSRPIVELYQGAVGQAYHRLYDPILPYKDEIRALMEGSDEIYPNRTTKAMAKGGQLF